VTNGTANTLAGGPANYTFNVVPSAQGLVTVSIPAGGCTDLALNSNTAATPLTRTYDATAPTVLLSAAAQDPTNASPSWLPPASARRLPDSRRKTSL